MNNINNKYLVKNNDDKNNNKRKMSYDTDDSWHPESGSGSDSNSESDSELELDSNMEIDESNDINYNSDIKDTYHKITKNVLEKIYNDVCNIGKIKNLDKYFDSLLKEINLAEIEMFDSSNTKSLNRASIELSNNIIRKVISDMRNFKDNMNDTKKFNIKNYLKNKIELHEEMSDLLSDINEKKYNTRDKDSSHISKKLKLDDNSNIVFNVQLDPFMTWKRSAFDKLKNYEEDYDEEDYEYEEYDDDEYDLDDFIVEDENYKKKNKNNDNMNEFKKLINSNNNSQSAPKYFKSLEEDDQKHYLNMLKKIKDTKGSTKPKLLKVVDFDTTLENKSKMISKIQQFDSLNEMHGEYFKLKKWVDGIMEVPFGKFVKLPISLSDKKTNIKKYIRNVKKIMDDATYGHEHAKKQILQIVAQAISNPNESGNMIAIQGPMGVGKTALIQDGISKALGRPFEFISLGGATDSAFLEGHDYTYEGSQCGKIVNVLRKSKCMNPIIFFDELDKVSDTPKGEEIINILMHLTDATQNHHFHDKFYTGIDFDLSKALFIFSFNDEYKIDKILRDRMYIIRTKGFKTNDKLCIAKDYMLPKLYKSIGFKNDDVYFPDDVLKFIIENYTYEGGVRKFKECLYEILREINLRKLEHSTLNKKKIKFPIKLNLKIIKDDIFSKRHVFIPDKIHTQHKVGLVNGLWASGSSDGTGGLIPIEALNIPSTEKLFLKLTGQQGDVMKESMEVAKTVAWNVIGDSFKKKLSDSWKKFGNTGIHIHCPDGATPKDGPSAGGAITTCIISLITGIPVRNDIAMTGEINFKGEIKQIGGLEEKILGAKRAGVKLVLCPKENKRCLDKIVNGKFNPLDDNFKVIPVENIWEVLNYALVDKKAIKKFNKY